MGSDRNFAWQQSSGSNFRFGSKADIGTPHVPSTATDQVHPLPIIDERLDRFEKTITDEMDAEIQAMFTAYAERLRARTLADTEHEPTRRLN
jgi:hypothetical protein